MEIRSITIKTSDLLAGDVSFQKLCKDVKIPSDKAKYWLAKCARSWRYAIEDYTTTRDSIIKEINPKTSSIEPKSEHMAAFVARNDELLKLTVTLDLPFFTLKESPSELTADDLANLWFMFDLDNIPEDESKEEKRP